MDDNDALVANFTAVVVGSRVGDAMGTPTEGLTADRIAASFGWVTDFDGDGTDDSLMASLLAAAITDTEGRAGADEWAAQLVAHHDQILAKRDKFFPSVLHLVEKLVAGYSPSQVAVGNMPSSSSAMCVWPVALVNAGDPASAAAQAYDIARLIHTGEVDFCTDGAAAVAGSIAAALRPDCAVGHAVAAGIAVLRPHSGAVMRTLIGEALDLAGDASGYEDFRTRYQQRFLRPIFCDCRETVPAALALAVLAGGDLRTAVEYAANFGRDADTIAAMTGALCGALGGPDAVPDEWLETLGGTAVESAQHLAGALAGVARRYASERISAVRHVPGLVAQGTDA